MHQSEDSYSPITPQGNQAIPQTIGKTSEPTVVAYVMPFTLIERSEPRDDGSVVHVVQAGQTGLEFL